MPSPAPILLFDGVCNLCNATVQFVLDHEAAPTLRFATLQSPEGVAVVEAHGGMVENDQPGSVLLACEGKLYAQSSAALRVARYLRWPYRALLVFLAVPRPMRDALYRFIAKRRYAWFGRSETCRVPTPELRARFLDAAPTDRP